MTTPQQNELRRSTHNAVDPEATVSEPHEVDAPGGAQRLGPVPEANRPGHHPDREQDQPGAVQDRTGARRGS